MTQVKYGVMAMLVMLLTATLIATSASAKPIHPISRSSHNPAGCYWRIHPRTHETGNLPAALAEVQHSLWLATQPHCGPASFIQSASRWSRLLIRPLQ